MRKRLVSAALAAAMALSMTACTSNPAEKETEAAAPADTEAAEEGEEKEAAADGDLITVGYAQVGAESDWRTANTESFKSTFTEENGYKLIFDDAQQKQENQIKAIRSFIQQGVDYIVVAPRPFWKKQKRLVSRLSFLTVRCSFLMTACMRHG